MTREHALIDVDSEKDVFCKEHEEEVRFLNLNRKCDSLFILLVHFSSSKIQLLHFFILHSYTVIIVA